MTFFNCIEKLPEGQTKNFVVHFAKFFRTSSRSNALQYKEFTQEEMHFYQNTKISGAYGVDFM
jgi:hypothetical protein